MRFFVLFICVLPLWATPHFDEFDKGRFAQSSFACALDAECGHGACVTSKCQCAHGYRDSTEAPCDHQMADLDKTAPWVLELGLGWIYPAGWQYLDIWPTVLTRLAIEGTAVGMLLKYFYERDQHVTDLRKENNGALAYFTGAVIFSALHFAAWVWSTDFLMQYDPKHSGSFETWHKDKGHADLVVLADKIQQSARITLDHFKGTDCAIVEQCVGGPGERALLRFDAYLNNIGDSDFVMGLEEVKPVWSPCHQHYHGPDTAKYFVEQKLTASNGTVVLLKTFGHKQGYCYVDSVNTNSTYAGKFGCGIPYFTKQFTQGISAGWSDIYDSDTDCQWVDITGLPPGFYNLSVTVNPKGIYYQDADLTNNWSILTVEVPDLTTDANKKAARSGNGIYINSVIVEGPRS